MIALSKRMVHEVIIFTFVLLHEKTVIFLHGNDIFDYFLGA